MNDKEFTEITKSIESKLEKEGSAIIADDLGRMMTGFETMQQTLKEKENRIKELEKDKEKLVLANGNLLKQIPVTRDDGDSNDNEDKMPSYENFDFKAALDDKGNFKK